MLMAASSPIPPLNVSYTPSSSDPICPSQSCVSFYHLWGLSHLPGGQRPFLPLLQLRGGRCVSALFAHVRHTAHCGATALKRPHFFLASLPPLMRPGQAMLLWLSFSFAPFLPFRGFFSLLHGAEAEPQTNFSHSGNEAWRAQFVSLRGNRIHSSVPQKTPFFQTERELFVGWQLQLSSSSSCDSFQLHCSILGYEGMLCTLQASYVIVHGDVCKEQSNCTSSAFKQRFQKFPSHMLQLKSRKHMEEHNTETNMVLKRKQCQACAFIVFTVTNWPLLIIWPPTDSRQATWPHSKEAGLESTTPSKPYVHHLVPLPERKHLLFVLFGSSLSDCSAVYYPIKSTPALFLLSDPTLNICFCLPRGHDLLLSPAERTVSATQQSLTVDNWQVLGFRAPLTWPRRSSLRRCCMSSLYLRSHLTMKLLNFTSFKLVCVDLCAYGKSWHSTVWLIAKVTYTTELYPSSLYI